MSNIVGLRGEEIISPGEVNPGAVEIAEKLLEMSRSGSEIKAIVALTIHSDEGISTFRRRGSPDLPTGRIDDDDAARYLRRALDASLQVHRWHRACEVRVVSNNDFDVIGGTRWARARRSEPARGSCGYTRWSR